jgi:UDP-3-O-[3-hydroxymyristoyl] glucosamine N-acyltransferase
MDLFSELCLKLDAVMVGPDRPVDGVAEPGAASERHVVVVLNKNILHDLQGSRALCWLVDQKLANAALLSVLAKSSRTYAVVSNAPRAMAIAISHFYETAERPGIDPTARVHETANIDSTASIGAFCTIGPNCRVGANSILYPRATLVENVELGERVRIQSGAVIGSEGFGFYEQDGKLERIPHIGRVVIEDDAWIGANCTIARGTLGETRIGRRCKIDNLVQIAHNVKIGDDTAIAAQVGIAGSTTIGSRVRIGGQAGLVGHIHVGDGATIGAQAGVISDVKPGQFVAGYPAEDRVESLRKEIYIKKIPSILEQLKRLKKR